MQNEECGEGWERPRAVMACADLRVEHARLMTEAWPDCRVLYIVRNGIEVVSSRMRFAGFREHPFERHCDEWAGTMAIDEWGSGAPGRYLLVRHEQLLEEGRAAACLKRVFEFLGVDECEACAAALTGTVHHPTGAQEGAPLGEQLKGRAERWREWTEEQRRCFEERCGEAMGWFGYAMPWVGEGAVA